MTQFPPRCILCPTDFSDLATLALAYAGEFAARADARLIVQYVDPFMPPPHFTARQVEEIAHTIEQSRLAAKEALGGYVKRNLTVDVETELVVSEGFPD
ncbi:MAG: universal stress protein [Acidobacteria bacterium]|nr:universal stress protein [Acidobacteriota bacterium]